MSSASISDMIFDNIVGALFVTIKSIQSSAPFHREYCIASFISNLQKKISYETFSLCLKQKSFFLCIWDKKLCRFSKRVFFAIWKRNGMDSLLNWRGKRSNRQIISLFVCCASPRHQWRMKSSKRIGSF